MSDEPKCSTCKGLFNRPRFVKGFHRLACACGERYRFDPGPLAQREMRIDDIEAREACCG